VLGCITASFFVGRDSEEREGAAVPIAGELAALRRELRRFRRSCGAGGCREGQE
jgi:hypothetical protein